MTHTQERIFAGKDRYGAHLMIGDFRSAMPSVEVATLLAAAPELLSALEFMVEVCLPLDRSTVGGLAAARAAIAKAKGTT